MTPCAEIMANLNNEIAHKKCIVKVYKGMKIINNDYKKYINKMTQPVTSK